MIAVFRNLLKFQNLLKQFTSRDVTSRYKGSYLGLVWTLIQPLVMLTIYTFVFSVVFKARWGQGESVSKVDFAMTIYAGMIIFQIFSEPLYRSSTIFIANSNFVKRVVFPLEILPTSSVLSSVIMNLFSFVIYIGALLWFQYPVGWNILLFPLIWIPLIILSAGLSYVFATLGVFFRDIGQIISILMNMLFYISPVFYPVTALPESFQKYMLFNPLTIIIENFRAITIYNSPPDWAQLGTIYIISIVIFLIGSAIFTYSKETFSDVI